ncbi:Ig-like domain-containing protein [Pantoea sp. SOD02]|uniref:Ig-like domain-containing protein n=1 Tax=Pantoea sp. SOD02 TaxID=2970818 RepID=UPI0021588D7D|nr:Ig-like domain-containing protein [Pantoea sp. SOD02]UVC27966.1 Ig-like domain-containing protein [Pantoea sp. SOD02]
MDILNYTGTKFTERATSLPTISGEAPAEIGKPGALALISVGGLYIQVPVDPVTGKYSWTATEPLPDGDYSLSVAIRDNAGNLGSPTLRTLRIDTTPPEAPLLINLYDDQGPEQRSFDPGATTDDKRPTLTGIAQKGATVYLLNDKDERIGSAVADKDTGLWKMEPSQDLDEGSNNLRLVAEEKFANLTRTGTPGASFSIILESGTLPPDTITITHAIDDVGSATGPLSNGALTDDTQPELRGTASAGSTVVVYYRLAGSNTWAGSATATVTGESWSWTPGSALPAGNYEFQASLGNISSALFMLDIASAADIITRTRIDSVTDDAGTATGPLSSGALTDDTTPTFIGTGEANSKVVLRFTRGSDTAASIVVDVDSAGRWSWTPSPALATGQWSFEVQAQGQSGWTAPFTLDISTDANYLRPYIDYAVDDVGPVTDNLRHNATTDDSTPTLHGVAQANSVLQLRYSAAGHAAITISFTADSSGKWSWAPPALADGLWSFEVKNPEHDTWATFRLNIDTRPEDVPAIDYADDNVGSYKGKLYHRDTTDDTTPTLQGTGAANSTIVLSYFRSGAGITQVNIIVDSSGKWTWTSPELADGTWHFGVANAAGQDSNAFTLNIDRNSDITPRISYAADNVGPSQSNLASGATTDDTTPTLHGTGAKNSAISLRYKLGSGGWTTTSVNIDNNGNWTWTPNSLAKGNWTFEVQKAGQSGWSSFTLNIDPLSAPSVPVILNATDDFGPVTEAIVNRGRTDDSTPTLNGTGVAGSTIYFQSTLTGVAWRDAGSVVVKSDGTWSWTSPQLTQAGTWDFRAKAGNAAGESAWSSTFVLTYTSTAPAIPVIVDGWDDFGGVKHSIKNGETTDDRTLTLRGTGAAGDLIRISYQRFDDQYNPVGEVIVKADGTWEWTTPELKENGAWYFRAQAVNGHGESGFAKFNFTIDPNVDTNPTIEYAADNVGPVTDNLTSGDTTDDSTPELHGTGPANSTIYLRATNGANSTVYSVVSNADGKWNWTPPAQLVVGDWKFQASNSAATGWGVAFALSIEAPQFGKFSYDFEDALSLPGIPRLSTSWIIDKEYEFPHGLTMKLLSGDAYLLKDPTVNAAFGNISAVIRNNSTASVNFKGAESVSWDFGGGNGGVVYITIYDTDGNTIKTDSIGMSNDSKVITKYSFKTPAKLIGWIDIRAQDISGVAFDNVKWERPSPLPSMIQTNNSAETEDLLNHVDNSIINSKNTSNKILKISIKDILQHGEDELFIANGTKQTMIQGNEGDVVQLKDILPEGSDISEWKHQDGTVTVAGVEYEVYSHGDDAELLVQQGVKTELV